MQDFDFYLLPLLEAGAICVSSDIGLALVSQISVLHNLASQLFTNPILYTVLPSFLVSSFRFLRKIIPDVKFKLMNMKMANKLIGKIELEQLKLESQKENTQEFKEELQPSIIRNLYIEENFNAYYEKVETECLDLWFVLNKKRIETKVKNGMKESEDKALSLFEKEFYGTTVDVVDDPQTLRGYSKKIIKQINKQNRNMDIKK